jgi:hypothetical protein
MKGRSDDMMRWRALKDDVHYNHINGIITIQSIVMPFLYCFSDSLLKPCFTDSLLKIIMKWFTSHKLINLFIFHKETSA